MAKQHHFYDGNHLHFITASTYRRTRLFDSPRFRSQFVEALNRLRSELRFQLVGYVLMPEHFHLLIWPNETANPSRIVGGLKQRTAKSIIGNLKSCGQAWCQQMLRQITLPESVHDESTYRVWQRRFYDFSVWSKRKRLEKLDHARQPGEAEVGGDPSRLALVELEVLPSDRSTLTMDRVP